MSADTTSKTQEARRASPAGSHAASLPLALDMSRYDLAQRCPACDGPESDEIADIDHNRYAKGFESVGLSMAPIKVVRCRACKSLWRRPWLRPEAMGKLYREVAPRHGAGHTRFLAGGAVLRGRAALATFLRRHAGDFQSYGEIGCPLWGLLPYFARTNYSILFGLFQGISGDGALPFVSVREIATTQSAHMRLLSLLVGLRPTPAPAKLFFGRPNLDCFWGHGCGQNGLTCRQMLDAIATCGNLEDCGSEIIDVLSLILILDHYPNPVELLEPLARRARWVFVFTHAPGHDWRAPQHRISFTIDGLKALAERSGFELVTPYRMSGPTIDFGALLRSKAHSR